MDSLNEFVNVDPPSLVHEDCSTSGRSTNCKENDLEFLGMKSPNAKFGAASILLCEDGASNDVSIAFKGNGLEFLEYKHLDTENKVNGASHSSQFDIASSHEGDVKISLICCNSSQWNDFCIPYLDAVLKRVEEKYIKTYRITEPGFSLVKLMKDVCECFWGEGTGCTEDRQLVPINVNSSLAFSNKFSSQDVLFGRNNQRNFCIPPSLPNQPFRFRNLIEVLCQIPRILTLNSLDVLQCIEGLNLNGNSYHGRDKKSKALEEGLGYSNPKDLVVFQKHGSYLDPLKAPKYVNDVTRGEENVKISLVNEINDECPPAFYYIPRNITYQNAYVKFLLARISDENCCLNCFGDCMSLDIPCACAGETGGEFAYTPGGLVEEKFLDKCISMSNDPEQHHFFYCKDCPLERSKNKRLSGQCRGHLVRKFIKECWYKCGCGKKCGNRVVQRGITVNLQVFMTSKGKGWGLRTLEDLPKGAFICEYVGEIVTNMELFERNTQMSGKDRHTYPVLLDADWGSEGILKDEEALCLDATNYGNVARFINHRCFDANLMEIPVEVETPDHHYYHLAFFTTRKVDALEELTWDYGIDFKDHSHPVKAFDCHCGSKFCRGAKLPKS
ncbi:hypothetical protein U1Q18_030917 [Sarracenia purpurea var. burkii]